MKHINETKSFKKTKHVEIVVFKKSTHTKQSPRNNNTLPVVSDTVTTWHDILKIQDIYTYEPKHN